MQLSILSRGMGWAELETGLAQLLPKFAVRADEIERSGESLEADIEQLRAIGLLRAALPRDVGGLGLGLGHDVEATLWTATTLRRLGRANLSLARLIEGHLNALKLVELHASAPARREVAELVAGGALLGIWGADGARPAALGQTPEGRYRLSGEKAFASGLGLVTLAVVTARTKAEGAAPQLVLVEATDVRRQHPEQWTAAGMRATCSGGFELDELEVPATALLGEPGEYLVEPHFEGGIWRYCAAHVGGAEALVETLRQSLLESGRAENEHQLSRLARAAAWCEAGRRLVEAAAVAVERSAGGTPLEIDSAVAQVLACRQMVEEGCVEVLTLVERSLGMRAHVAESRIERQRRDLSLFIRQADPDGKLVKAGRLIAGSAAEVGEQW